MDLHAPLLAKQLGELGKKPEARRVLLAMAERNPDKPNHLTKLVDYDIELQSWNEVVSRITKFLALDPPPIKLLTKIWQLQDVLNLSPDYRQRLKNLVE